MSEKVLNAAIRCHMPMSWSILPCWYYKRLELRVATAILETGAERTRRISSCVGLEDAFLISLRIYGKGGRLDCTALLDSDLDIWSFGWRPELDDLREMVRR